MLEDVSLGQRSCDLEVSSDLELAQNGGVINDPLCVGAITRNHHDPKISHNHLHLKAEEDELQAEIGLNDGTTTSASSEQKKS